MTDQPDQKPAPEPNSEKIPELLPILPLFDAALFPKMVLPLVVMQGESVRLVDEAMAQNRIIGLVVSKKPEEGNKPDRGDLASIGTSALILKMAKTQDNRTQLLVQGLHRFKIKSWENSRPYLRARIQVLEEDETKGKETEALMSNLIGQFIRIVELSPGPLGPRPLSIGVVIPDWPSVRPGGERTSVRLPVHLLPRRAGAAESRVGLGLERVGHHHGSCRRHRPSPG